MHSENGDLDTSHVGPRYTVREAIREADLHKTLYCLDGGMLGLSDEMAPDMSFARVLVPSQDRNLEYTPWPAPDIFDPVKTCPGQAGVFLDSLARLVRSREVDGTIGIMGVSLSGLASIYSLYVTDVFDAVISVSGSLWYSGFLDFARCAKPVNTRARVYICAGDREGNMGGRLAMRQVEYAREFAGLLEEAGLEVTYEELPGSHMGKGRIACALSWFAGL